MWAVANAAFFRVSSGAGMDILFIGGMFIFPLTTVVLKRMGGPASLPKGHPSATVFLIFAVLVFRDRGENGAHAGLSPD